MKIFRGYSGSNLSVFPDSQRQHKNTIHTKSAEIGQNVPEVRTFKHYHANYFHEVEQRIDSVEPSRPLRHRFNRCKDTAHKDKNKQKEKRQKHHLLLG